MHNTGRHHFIYALIVYCSLVACRRDNAATSTGPTGPGQLEQLELRYQGSNGVVWYPELAEDLGYLAPIKLNWIGNTISGPQDIQTVVTGDVDYGGAFNGAIIKLIAAKAPIRAVVGYYGIDDKTFTGYYVIEDSPIRGPRDLIGKKVAMNTVGAHMEFVLREYLSRGGLSAEEIKQVTLVAMPPINTEQALRQAQVEVGALANVFRDRATERPGLRLLFSDHELLGNFTAGSIVFSEQHMKAWPNTIRKFVEAHGKAVEWARSQPLEVVQARMAAILAKRKRGEDPGMAKYWKSTGINKPGGRIADSEFQVWLDWLIKDGTLKPGQLKLQQLFSNQFNTTAE